MTDVTVDEPVEAPEEDEPAESPEKGDRASARPEQDGPARGDGDTPRDGGGPDPEDSDTPPDRGEPDPGRDEDAPPPRPRRPPAWSASAALVAVAAGGLALFISSLRGIDLNRMNGLGLLSVLPARSIVGVVVIALAFVVGLALRRARPVGLAALLIALVVCLDGVTIFAEPEPRFPTAYQILGFVNYISTTGHAAPSLAAYFSWPGFFALISFLTGAAGVHSILTLVRVWPVAIDLLCLPPLFLLMRNLRVSWRAQWLAAFFFSVGNWVGQDYFSPQSFGYLLYIVFVAILVNWFVGPGRAQPVRVVQALRSTRLSRRLFRNVRPGELPALTSTPGQRAFLLVMLIAIFTVATASHQLTPIFMIGACLGLVLIRRCALPGLPVLLGVVLVGYFSFAAIGYWSGHLSNVFSGLGSLGFNVSTSVGGRLQGSTPTHLLALHAKVIVAAIVIGMAGLGLLRRRWRGLDDRVLVVLLIMPIVLIGAVSYGGEIALRTYLFMLPVASVLAALAFFPGPRSTRVNWRPVAVLVVCAVVLPVGFFLARYGNEAFEQTPPGELAAANWVYAHDTHGARLLWLSTDPANDVTPQMPWSYRDLDEVDYIPTQAPRNPTSVYDLIVDLVHDGPHSYLIETQTEVAAMQQTTSYPAGWGSRFRQSMATGPFVRVVYSSDSAVVFTLDWPANAPVHPLGSGGRAQPARFTWTQAGLLVFLALLAMMAIAEFTRIWHPSARRIRILWLASMPLFALLMADVILRFAVLS